MERWEPDDFGDEKILDENFSIGTCPTCKAIIVNKASHDKKVHGQ